MRENLDVFGFALTDAQVASIDSLDTGKSSAIDHHDPAGAHMAGTARYNT